MKKKVKTIYRTHPVYKAMVVMLLLVTAFTVVAGYLTYCSAERKAARYEALRERAAYEAYLTLCESVSAFCQCDSDDVKAYVRIGAEAAARLDLFSDFGSEALTEYVGRLGGKPSEASMLSVILDPERDDWRGAVREATELANENGVKDAVGERSADGEWRLLRECAEVNEAAARTVAREYIGGGVGLASAENHSFPLVYSFVCENAAADVTRMGGKLYRMWAFRIGDAEKCGEAECREAAVSFLRRAGIRDAELSSETYAAEDISYVFSVPGIDYCRAIVTVRRRGGKVSFFDAEDYYRYR